MTEGDMVQSSSKVSQEEHYHLDNYVQGIYNNPRAPQSTEGPYLDHGETTNKSIEKVYVTTLVTTMGLFKYVDGGNSKITPKK